MNKVYPILVLLAMILPTFQLQADESTYIRPQVVQYSDPMSFTSDGVKYTVYWVNPNKEKNPTNLTVSDVYIVPENYTPKRSGTSEEIPPRLAKFRLHDLGDNGFVEAIVVEKATNQNFYRFGIKLPDEVAYRLLDLLAGRTKFKVMRGKIEMLDKAEKTTSSELIKREYIQ